MSKKYLQIITFTLCCGTMELTFNTPSFATIDQAHVDRCKDCLTQNKDSSKYIADVGRIQGCNAGLLKWRAFFIWYAEERYNQWLDCLQGQQVRIVGACAEPCRKLAEQL